MRIDAFWDTSALVPLCTGQAATPRAAAHYKNYGIAVWWATPVEIAAGLARLLRTRQVTAIGLMKAQKAAQRLADEWRVIRPNESIRTRAIDVVGRFDLRAADSLQLAAALEWCEDQPQGQVLLSADLKLREAALAAGFDAKTV